MGLEMEESWMKSEFWLSGFSLEVYRLMMAGLFEGSWRRIYR